MLIPNIINAQYAGTNNSIESNESIQSIKNEILQLEKQIESNKSTTNIKSDLNTSTQKSIQMNLENKVNEVDSAHLSSISTPLISTYVPTSVSLETPNEISLSHDNNNNNNNNNNNSNNNNNNDEMVKIINELNNRIVALENLNKHYQTAELNSTNFIDDDKTSINIQKLDTNEPNEISFNSSLRLPLETDDELSYMDVQSIQPTTQIKINPNDVYQSNIKKLDAIDSMNNLQKTDKKCVIM